MTPPFFPGKKLLWVENAPYFFSRDQKGELGERILELWREGKTDSAAKLLIDLLVVEGWTQEQSDKLTGTTPLGRIGSPDDVAQAVLYLLSSDYVTGEVLLCSGGSRV